MSDRLEYPAFSSLCKGFGAEFGLDPFASPSNARVPCFFSRFRYPGAASVAWHAEKMFVCPPVKKLIATWRKIQISIKCPGVLVFPLWRSSLFWLILFPDGLHAGWPTVKLVSFRPFIKLGTFYAGSMQGSNSYPFIAIYFDTSFLAPVFPTCVVLPCISCNRAQ